MLNENQKKPDTSVVEFGISSLEGITHKKASAYTTKRVTGNIQVIDWNFYKTKCGHLEDIKFLPVGYQTIVELLIGVNHSELLYWLPEPDSNPV